MPRLPLPRFSPYRAIRGQSIVELLVGLAVGLTVVAAAATLLVAQVREQRSLRLESRLMHDLAAAADLIARDLRRAGHWGDAVAGVWVATAPVPANPYAALVAIPGAAQGVSFSYSRDEVENGAVDENELFGWRLRAGVVELQLGGRWQAVTDASVLSVTAFELKPMVDEIDLGASCLHLCEAAAAAAGTCPPRQQVRSLSVRIAGQATGNAHLTRALETQVRLRNDVVTGACTG